jgi:hypothetical protein
MYCCFFSNLHSNQMPKGKKWVHYEDEESPTEEESSEEESEDDADQVFLDEERNVYRIYQNLKTDLAALHPSFGDQLSFATFTHLVAKHSSVLTS